MITKVNLNLTMEEIILLKECIGLALEVKRKQSFVNARCEIARLDKVSRIEDLQNILAPIGYGYLR